VKRRLALAALLCACSLTAAGAQQTPIKIGFIYSFSAGAGIAGRELNDTIALFQKRYGDSAGGGKSRSSGATTAASLRTARSVSRKR
jgi:hypothetical protein